MPMKVLLQNLSTLFRSIPYRWGLVAVLVIAGSALGILPLYFGPLTASAQQRVWKEWTEQSFQDFSRGTFGNGGADIYVSSKGRMQTINRWDLNQDGYIDLFFGNTHDTNYVEPVWLYLQGHKEPVSLASRGGYRILVTDLNRDGHPDLVVGNADDNISASNLSFVYWGKAAGFNSGRRTELRTEAVSGIAAGDLNADGHTDLVFANTDGGNSFVYWGGPGGFSNEDRTDLPTDQALGVAVADLNNDGLLDVIFANGNKRGGGSYIYWGNRQQFTQLARTVLETRRALAVAAADLNGDGHPELVFADWNGPAGRAVIYWGGAAGYSVERRAFLPVPGIFGVTVADLDRDGRPDLLVPCGISGEHAYGLREYRGNKGEVGHPPSLVYWGGKDGYSAERRTELPTMAATSAAVGDYNGDGRLDVAVAQLQSDGQYETDSLLFLGTESGLDTTRPLRFRTRGAADVAMADLNGDGKLDLAFANKVSGNAKGTLPSYVYWGGPEGFSASKRLELPSSSSNEGKFADFNDDGWTDVFICNQDHEDRTLNTGSSIFWGGPNGWASPRRTRIDVFSCFGAAVADLDRDGQLDIVISVWDETDDSLFIYWGGRKYSRETRTILPQKDGRQTVIADLNQDGHLDIAVASYVQSDVKIFWGGPKGFSGERSQSLPALGAVGVETADLNRDGHADLVVCNFGAPGSEIGSAASYVYWGSAAGFSPQSRTELPTMAAHDATVVDLNSDGYVDLVFTNYRNRDSRTVPAYVYWGSASGLDARHRSLLPARGAAGMQVADLNRDGVLDIVFANHVTNQGDHRTDSMILWGSPQGLYGSRKITWLPTLGPHNMLSVDMGNRLTRKLQEEFISVPHHAGSPVAELDLSWEGEQPAGSRLLFQIRSASSQEGLASAPWQGPTGERSYFDSPGHRFAAFESSHAWLQYRVLFTSLDGGSSPVLNKVAIKYR